MGKLTSLPPRFGGVRQAQQARRDYDSRRNQDRTRKLYKTKRWQRLRLEVFERDLFTCAFCAVLVSDTSKLVCDHVVPHRGDEGRFWSGPFQTLCKRCHDSDKQKMERSGKAVGAVTHPEWIKPARGELTIVCGPPASGKSTLVAERAGPDDLVIDLDLIVAKLRGKAGHDWERSVWLVPALRQRNQMLKALARRSGRAWFVVSEASAERRKWWAEKLEPAEVIVIETSVAQCLAHAKAAGRKDLDQIDRVVRAWWKAYTPRIGETIMRADGGR